jgi:hypothetical protein
VVLFLIMAVAVEAAERMDSLYVSSPSANIPVLHTN